MIPQEDMVIRTQEDIVIRTIEKDEGRYFHAGDLVRLLLSVSRDPNLTMNQASELRMVGEMIKALAAKEV